MKKSLTLNLSNLLAILVQLVNYLHVHIINQVIRVFNHNCARQVGVSLCHVHRRRCCVLHQITVELIYRFRNVCLRRLGLLVMIVQEAIAVVRVYLLHHALMLKSVLSRALSVVLWPKLILLREPQVGSATLVVAAVIEGLHLLELLACD